MEKELKTGAVICTKLIAGTDVLEYEALLFVKNIPADFSNEQFKKATLSLLKVETRNCHSLLFQPLQVFLPPATDKQKLLQVEGKMRW